MSQVILRLSIPEHEITPKLRMALTALAREIERLKKELLSLRKKATEAEQVARHDILLPMLNRGAFMREVARAIAAVERYGTPASLVYIDLDDFKTINDTYGHAAGDAALRDFAELLTANVRETDAIGRIGGDEFAILLTHAGLEWARKKGAQLFETMTARLPRWQGQAIAISFSFGSYELRAGDTAESALSKADLAMYAQKHARAKAG